MQKLVATLVVGVLFTAAGIFGADVRIGTWKYNAAKSKTNSSNPIKTQVDVLEATPDGRVSVSRTGQFADGTAFKYSFSFKYDGRDYKVQGAPFDVIAVKRIDANTTSFEASKTGSKYLLKGKTVISPDGQTRTQTTQGTDAAGKPLSQTLVFNRI